MGHTLIFPFILLYFAISFYSISLHSILFHSILCNFENAVQGPTAYFSTLWHTLLQNIDKITNIYFTRQRQVCGTRQGKEESSGGFTKRREPVKSERSKQFTWEEVVVRNLLQNLNGISTVSRGRGRGYGLKRGCSRKMKNNNDSDCMTYWVNLCFHFFICKWGQQ